MRTSSQDSVARVREDAPAVSQERMKRELGALLLEASRLRPFVLFLDDLHWADVSTIDMLNYLAGRFDQMRLLVLATYRPADMTLAQHPFLAIRDELRAHGALEEIPLGFLDRPRRRALPRRDVSAAPLPAVARGDDPREDRRQPALHGRRRPLPARFGQPRRA